MRAASASAIESAAAKECDLQSIETMCSLLAETLLGAEVSSSDSNSPEVVRDVKLERAVRRTLQFAVVVGC